MPSSYSIDKARGLVISRFWGVLSDDDVRNHRQRLAADNDFNPSFHHLADMREMIVVAVTDAVVTEVARASVFGRGARRAFVLDEEQYLRSGLERLFQQYSMQAPSQQIKVFHDLEVAERWVEFGGS